MRDRLRRTVLPTVKESHLTEQQIEDYRRRTLVARERGECDRHLARCDVCLQRVIDAAHSHLAFTALAESLLPAVGDEPFHLSFEELKRYSARQLDQAETVIFESHLQDCAKCKDEAQQLILIGSGTTPAQQAVKDSWWLRPSLRPAYVGVALACLIILVGILWIQSRLSGGSKPAASQIANTAVDENRSLVSSRNDNAHRGPTEASGKTSERRDVAPDRNPVTASQRKDQTAASTFVRLIDGSRIITWESGGPIRDLDGLELSTRREVIAALSGEGLKRPASVAALTAPSINLLDQSATRAAFTLLGPKGTVIADDRPKFRWQPLEGASSYTISVFDENFNLIVRSVAEATTQWSPPEPLERGRTYFWEVSALKDGQEITSPVAPAPRSQFKIVDREKFEQINRAKRERPDSHLVLGILYAHAGLLHDAERELQLLVNANPHSPVAKRLLRRVQSWEKRGR